MPSPGISVIRCFINALVFGFWSLDFALECLSIMALVQRPKSKDQRPKSTTRPNLTMTTVTTSTMSELPKTAEVAIIGGGVIGLAVARALALRGMRDVLLIERASLGAEASSAAAGMLAPQAEADCDDEFFQLCCQSRDLYPAFAQLLHEETGIDIELETTGTLYLAFTEEDESELEKRYAVAKARRA